MSCCRAPSRVGAFCLAVFTIAAAPAWAFPPPEKPLRLDARPYAAIAAAEGDDQWSDGFGLPGVSGRVYTAVSYGDGIVAAGYISLAGGVPVNNIARWDGTSWSPLGSGLEMHVDEVAVYDGEIFAGGAFERAGDIEAPGLARWDGASWSACGPEAPQYVLAFTTYGGDLIAAGYVLGLSGYGLARWNGTSWSAFGTPIGPWVRTLAVYHGEIYAGGDIGVVRWDGTQWSAVAAGAGHGHGVEALVVHSDRLYAGGSFRIAGDPQAKEVAAWDGTSWSTVGDGPGGTVQALADYRGCLLAGGTFGPDGFPKEGLVFWNGVSWSVFGGGAAGSVHSLSPAGGELIAGGEFRRAGGTTAAGIARWDGMEWHALGDNVGDGLDGAPAAFALQGGDLIAGGDFTHVGEIAANGVARWNGSAWSALGDGIPYVRAVTVFGDQVIASGGDRTFGNVRTARWDGSSWIDMEPPLADAANAFAVYNGELFAAGGFIDPETGDGSGALVRWDGSAWEAFAPTPDGVVYAMLVKDGRLIVGGDFAHVGGLRVGAVAQWDGSSWSSLGSGVDRRVFALAAYNDHLIAAGEFYNAGGNPAHNVARWDGTHWHALGSGLDEWVLALSVYNGTLVAGGGFTMAGGQFTPCIARWNGSVWSGLGSGLDGGVTSLAASGGSLFVGGWFAAAGRRPSFGIACWDDLPAAVMLASFSAERRGLDGLVRWEVVERGHHASFDLYRQREEGPRLRMNAAPLTERGRYEFTDRSAPTSACTYWLTATDRSGATRWFGPAQLPAAAPGADLSLAAGGPSPFRPPAALFYTLPAPCAVRLSIHDVRGRMLAVLDAGGRAAGQHEVHWNGCEARGRRMPSGVYFAKLDAGGRILRCRLVLAR